MRGPPLTSDYSLRLEINDSPSLLWDSSEKNHQIAYTIQSKNIFIQYQIEIMATILYNDTVIMFYNEFNGIYFFCPRKF